MKMVEFTIVVYSINQLFLIIIDYEEIKVDHLFLIDLEDDFMMIMNITKQLEMNLIVFMKVVMVLFTVFSLIQISLVWVELLVSIYQHLSLIIHLWSSQNIPSSKVGSKYLLQSVSCIQSTCSLNLYQLLHYQNLHSAHYYYYWFIHYLLISPILLLLVLIGFLCFFSFITNFHYYLFLLLY